MNVYGEPNGFFDFLSEVPLFFIIFGGGIVTLVVGAFLFVIIKSLSSWTSNNAAELVTRACKVVDKRTEVWGGSGDSSANTNYYITFEFEDRSRMELPVRSDRYGLIVVGDHGEVSFQGTRFKEFKRT